MNGGPGSAAPAQLERDHREHQEIAASVDALRDAGEAATDRVKRRLAEVHALLGEEMADVDRQLARLARDGESPATDSAAHLLEAGGKRVRPLTVMLSASCFCSPPPSARDIAVVAELVHLATLLHDDVLDESRERRGRLASRCIWGNAVSVLAGDLLLTHALERTEAAAPHSVLVDLFATLRRLVDGEVVQLRGRKQLDPREEVYFHIVRHKTAALFEWAARSGAVCAGAAPEAANALAEFGSRIGLAFQLVDDVLDYTGDPSATGKALFGDLQEGKLTLPLIRAVSSGAVSISDVEAVRGGDPSHAARIANAVRSSGVCDGVRAVALEQTARALASLEPVPRSAARDMLGAIARELAVRGA